MNHYSEHRTSIITYAYAVYSQCESACETNCKTQLVILRETTESLSIQRRKRGLSLVRNAGHILEYADLQTPVGFLRRVGDLSFLSYESTFSTAKKKKKRRKNLRSSCEYRSVTGRRSLTLPVFRMHGIAHDDLHLIGHVTKLFRRIAFLSFSFSSVPPTVAA